MLSQTLCLGPIGCLGTNDLFFWRSSACSAGVGRCRLFCFLLLSFLAVVFFSAGVGFHGCGCSCHAPVMGFFSVLVCFSAICLDSSGACSSAVLSGLCPLPGTSFFGRGLSHFGVFLFLPRASTLCLPPFQQFAWASGFF